MADALDFLRKELAELDRQGLLLHPRTLEGEQRAWHALMDIRVAGWTTPDRLWSTGFEQEWPSALDSVAAEVRALAGKVLAMHPH